MNSAVNLTLGGVTTAKALDVLKVPALIGLTLDINELWKGIEAAPSVEMPEVQRKVNNR